jgi:hypothetical protein
MAVKAVPEGWHTVTPRLFVYDAAKLVVFLQHAFGASGNFPNRWAIGNPNRRFDYNGRRGGCARGDANIPLSLSRRYRYGPRGERSKRARP